MNLKKSLVVLPVLSAVLTLGACGSDDADDNGSSDENSSQPTEESGSGEGYSVDVTKCEFDETMMMVKVDTEITNGSDAAHSYIVHVDVMDGSGQKVTTVHSTTDEVASGESATTDGLAQVSADPKGVTCEVTDATVS